jgi:hypothetical protein
MIGQMPPPSQTRPPSNPTAQPSGPTSWQEFRDTVSPTVSNSARNALTDRFSGMFNERYELSRAVGARSRDEPLHRLVPYKEAFSPPLVRAILDHTGTSSGMLLDPFVGAGTSLLVASERGLGAVGVDLLPFAAFTADALLRAAVADWDLVRRYASRVQAATAVEVGEFPDFPVRDWAFTPAALAELTRLHRAIKRLPLGTERDMVRLALLFIVEQISQATKDGTSLRRRAHSEGRRGRYRTRRTRNQVVTAFLDCLSRLEADATEHSPPMPASRAVIGDARRLRAAVGDDAHFDICIFSPPYPNRYDYTANYQLELGFGFVADRNQLKGLRRAQFRSHLEAPWPEDRTVASPALDEFLTSLLARKRVGDQTGRTFRMVAGYFEDMSSVLAGVAACMRPGAPVGVVVGTQVFAGQELPTDLLIAEIADSKGFTVKDLWMARRKGVAVQQRARYSSIPTSRETVILLEA